MTPASPSIGTDGAEPVVRAVAAVDLVLVPYDWPLARTRRAEIDAHFAAVAAVRPHLWNGRLLLARNVALVGATLRGEAFETDFASFLWWRDCGFPDPAVRNVFAMAAVRSRDGAFLLGVMGDHTANAGRVYFPAGTPDPDDVCDGRIDFAASAARELAEETGLDAARLPVSPHWSAVFDGPRIALMRQFAAPQTGAALVSDVRAYLAGDPGAELADALAVGRISDLPAATPAFMRAFLRQAFAG